MNNDMIIQVNYGDVAKTDALERHVHERIQKALQHVSDEVTRVEVHLRDDKSGRKDADDQRCLMEARIAGRQPLAIEERGANLYDVINEASDKLQRAVEKISDKRKTH